MTKTAILLSGAKGSGKSTVARFLQWHFDCEHYILAGPLKHMARQMLEELYNVHAGFSRMDGQTEEDRAWRETPLQYPVVKNDQRQKLEAIVAIFMLQGILFLLTLSSVKDSVLVFILFTLFIILATKRLLRQGDAMLFTPQPQRITPRLLLQRMGTEWMRTSFGPNVHCNTLLSFVREDQNSLVPPQRIVVSDVRFANEAEMLQKELKRCGFSVICLRLRRAKEEVGCGEHASEQEWMHLPGFEDVDNNDKSMDELFTNIRLRVQAFERDGAEV